MVKFVSTNALLQKPQRLAVELAIAGLATVANLCNLCTPPRMFKKAMNVHLIELWTGLIFFGLVDRGLFHCKDCSFVSGPYP